MNVHLGVEHPFEGGIDQDIEQTIDVFKCLGLTRDFVGQLLRLELEARLRAVVEQAGTPWWEQISGTFANDPICDEAMRLGRKWRESQRPEK